MKCRHLAKILPELVSGELDERIARTAEEHISACASCAAERAEYEVALGALARANSMAEVPPALDVLRIPEERPARRSWLQPAFATLAAAAVLTLIVLMPHPFRPTPETPKKATEIAQVPPPQAKITPEHVDIVRAPAVKVAKSEPRRVPKSEVSPPAERWYADTAGRAPSAPESPESSAIVVAYDFGEETPASIPSAPASRSAAAEQPPASSVVEIESNDPDTGSVSVYNYSRDSEGRERVIEMTSNVRADSVGGTQP